MSSSFIENQIPHSVFPNDSFFVVSPKGFDCTCFAYNISQGLDKYFAKVIKCVFWGYSCP